MIYKSFLIENDLSLIKENIVLFYGENLGLQDDLKQMIKKENRKASFLNFEQDEILKNEETFYSEILNISLFNENKIFFLNNSNDKILEKIKKIEEKLNDQKIFIFSNILDKKSKLRNYFESNKKFGVVACYKDNEMNIRKIIQNKLKDFKNLSTDNINMLSDACNLDRSKLNNELNKIITFFSDKIINNEKLKSLLNLKSEENFNVLKDEVLNGNKIKTNKLISETVMEQEKNILYLALINQRLLKLAEINKISKASSIEVAINKIKPPIFWKDKNAIISQAKKWNLTKINTVLKKTYELEIQIKSSSYLNPNSLIKKLLLDICLMANS